jgi:hypothetical protein
VSGAVHSDTLSLIILIVAHQGAIEQRSAAAGGRVDLGNDGIGTRVAAARASAEGIIQGIHGREIARAGIAGDVDEPVCIHGHRHTIILFSPAQECAVQDAGAIRGELRHEEIITRLCVVADAAAEGRLVSVYVGEIAGFRLPHDHDAAGAVQGDAVSGVALGPTQACPEQRRRIGAVEQRVTGRVQFADKCVVVRLVPLHRVNGWEVIGMDLS